ncbi:MAG: phosphopantetheine-binding protein, partial [Actinomycetota bacterium]|nr:phosphopantetheine-binding protein [Actinomycetota bacterium]
SSSYVGPRTDTERLVVDLWQQMLEVERVGVHDNFFDLGGNSLLVAAMVDRLSRQSGATVPIRTIFFDATVENTARIVDSRSVLTGTEDDFGVESAFVHALSDDDVKALLNELDTPERG